VNDTQKNKTKKPEEGRPNLKKKKQKKKTEEPDRRPNSIGHLVTRWDSFACEKITVVLKKKQKKLLRTFPA
jgi:hypothetical protein